MNPEVRGSEPWTVARLLNWTREHFAGRGIESPRLCAELLLAHALGCERIHLYTRFEHVPTAEALHTFRDLVREAAAGKPIAYLTGVKEFFSLAFSVSPDVLVPRPETEVLVERTITLVRSADNAALRILDLGTGSGCIAISLAKHLPDACVCASDASPAALAVARANAERHAVAERIEFRPGDLFEPWQAAGGTPPGLFDLIVSNPPYLAEAEAGDLPATVRDYEPRVALFAGADGLSVTREIVAQAPRWLRAGGHLLLETAYNRAAAVRALFSSSFWGDVVTYRDAGQHERVVQARCRVAEQSQVA